MIRTPAELRAARENLGLSRKEFADLTGDTESFIRMKEHTKSIDIPAHLVRELERLQELQTDMEWGYNPTRSNGVFITYHSDDDLEKDGGPWDKRAPTASFHRTLYSVHTRGMEDKEKPLLIAFNYPLFAASRYADNDTFENRRLWALDWAKQYQITEGNES